MIKKFKLEGDTPVEPWTLLFQGIQYLDEAAQIASEEKDVEALIELSKQIDARSDKLIQVYLMLSGEDELPLESNEEPSPKLPLGFVKAPEAEVDECGCDCDEEEE
jgi:hypothetical protein